MSAGAVVLFGAVHDARVSPDARDRRVPADSGTQPATQGVPRARQVCRPQRAQARQHR